MGASGRGKESIVRGLEMRLHRKAHKLSTWWTFRSREMRWLLTAPEPLWPNAPTSERGRSTEALRPPPASLSPPRGMGQRRRQVKTAPDCRVVMATRSSSVLTNRLPLPPAGAGL